MTRARLPRGAQVVRARPVRFDRGPVPCRQCGAMMRPTASLVGDWPKRTVVHGGRGLCVACADEGLPPAPPAPAPAAAAAPAPAPVVPGAATQRAVPRRRPRRRFDYRPQAAGTCPACGTVYDPTTGTCRCNDKP